MDLKVSDATLRRTADAAIRTATKQARKYMDDWIHGEVYRLAYNAMLDAHKKAAQAAVQEYLASGRAGKVVPDVLHKMSTTRMDSVLRAALFEAAQDPNSELRLSRPIE